MVRSRWLKKVRARLATDNWPLTTDDLPFLRQHRVHVAVRARDDVHADDFALECERGDNEADTQSEYANADNKKRKLAKKAEQSGK